MTTEELVQGGIIVDGNISDKDLGLLLLKYNKIYLGEEDKAFTELSKKILKKFNFGDRGENYLSKEEDFAKYCLAICDKSIQNAYIKENNNTDRLFAVHNVVVKKAAKNIESKENIRQARTLADECDNLRIRGQKYIESKDQYEYMVSCINDENVFENFYSRLQGRLDKESARKMLETKFGDIQNKFLANQDKYLEYFTNYEVKEDARVLGRTEEKVG